MEGEPARIISRDRSPGPDHAQHSGFERRARFRRREHLSLQAGPEAVDEDAGRPEARQLDDRGQPELDQGPERHPFEVQAGGGDVLAEVAGANLEATSRRDGKSSDGIRWTCRRLGRRGRRRAK